MDMQMMAMHEQMMADMNAAKGTAKTNAIAAVINEMVSQQKQMMAKMQC